MPPLLTGIRRVAFILRAPVSSGLPLNSHRLQPLQRYFTIRPKSA